MMLFAALCGQRKRMMRAGPIAISRMVDASACGSLEDYGSSGMNGSDRKIASAKRETPADRPGSQGTGLGEGSVSRIVRTGLPGREWSPVSYSALVTSGGPAFDLHKVY